MEIDIQELTENEKKQQLKERHLVYNRRLFNYCEALDVDPQKYMQEYYHNIAIHSDEYKNLEAENQRLKEQLNKEIHINRKMKSALEKYATMELEDGVCYDSFTGETFRDEIYDLETGEPPQRLAQQVLKEIDNKE